MNIPDTPLPIVHGMHTSPAAAQVRECAAANVRDCIGSLALSAARFTYTYKCLLAALKSGMQSPLMQHTRNTSGAENALTLYDSWLC